MKKNTLKFLSTPRKKSVKAGKKKSKKRYLKVTGKSKTDKSSQDQKIELGSPSTTIPRVLPETMSKPKGHNPKCQEGPPTKNTFQQKINAVYKLMILTLLVIKSTTLFVAVIVLVFICLMVLLPSLK